MVFDNKISPFSAVAKCRISQNHEIRLLNASKPGKSVIDLVNLVNLAYLRASMLHFDY